MDRQEATITDREEWLVDKGENNACTCKISKEQRLLNSMMPQARDQVRRASEFIKQNVQQSEIELYLSN